jgi:hypothetical protein
MMKSVLIQLSSSLHVLHMALETNFGPWGAIMCARDNYPVAKKISKESALIEKLGTLRRLAVDARS